MAKMSKEERLAKQAELQAQEAENMEKFMNGGEDSDLNQNPLLMAGTMERGYAEGEDNVDVIGNIPSSIPEPEEQRTVIDFTESHVNLDAEGNEINDLQDGGQDKKPPLTVGDGMHQDISDEEKKQQKIMTGNAADTAIDLYKGLISLGKSWGQRTPESYQAKAMQGKFDMRVLDEPIPHCDGATLNKFLPAYNSQIEEGMQLDPKTETEMRTVLKRIALKRGLGMSDEARFGMLMLQDAGSKISLLYSSNKMLKNIESMLAENIKNGGTKPTQEKQKTTKIKEEPEVFNERGED
jgi:hypothetical protein